MRRVLLLALLPAALLVAACEEQAPLRVDATHIVISENDGQPDLKHAVAACQAGRQLYVSMKRVGRRTALVTCR